MALNPDTLNLNYDSDDSMQVDSDSDHPLEHPSPVHPPPDPDPDADPDADAEGDAEYVDDTASAVLENPVAGPSTYPHKDFVGPLFLSPFRSNPWCFPKDAEDSVCPDHPSLSLLTHIVSQGYEDHAEDDDDDDDDDASYADDEYGKKASRKKKKKVPSAPPAPRPKSSYTLVYICSFH